MEKYFVIHFLLINLLSVIVCVWDKISAKKHRRRIRERTLFALTLLGGGFAMYLTMVIIRHKTRHKRFMVGIPLIILLQILILLAIFLGGDNIAEIFI